MSLNSPNFKIFVVFTAGLLFGVFINSKFNVTSKYIAYYKVQDFLKDFDQEIEKEVSALPASHQLLADVATKRALNRVLKKTKEDTFWSK